MDSNYIKVKLIPKETVKEIKWKEVPIPFSWFQCVVLYNNPFNTISGGDRNYKESNKKNNSFGPTNKKNNFFNLAILYISKLLKFTQVQEFSFTFNFLEDKYGDNNYMEESHR